MVFSFELKKVKYYIIIMDFHFQTSLSLVSWTQYISFFCLHDPKNFLSPTRSISIESQPKNVVIFVVVIRAGHKNLKVWSEFGQ